MATLKATILQNFATIGIPDFEEEESVSKNWSIVGLSENLIEEDRLVGLQHLNTRRLDLVIHNGSKFALLNLQAFKIFECQVATDTIKECVAHYLTPDGNLLFGVQTSGDVVVLTDGLQTMKHIRKPVFMKFKQKQPRWYEEIATQIVEYFSIGNRSNQVSPEATLRSVQISGTTLNATVQSSAWWQSGVASSLSLAGLTENIKSQFPYLTSLMNGLAIFCAFSPTDCYIFLSSYETALRVKSVANIKASQVPGRWYRIIMHKSFLAKWLEDRRMTPVLEARLCYKKGEQGDQIVGGAMSYGVMEDLRLDIVYGIIKRRSDKFTLAWEMLQFDVDWALRESDGEPYNLGSRFITKLSSDCTKIAIVISNHLGMYIHVQEIPFYSDNPIHLKRQRVSLCNHSDYDGCHFYKQECWIADIQWLVEDAYFAVMTLCGSLSIFYSTGEPMIVKVRKPGPEYDEDKSARFYYPVFHPHQIVTSKHYHDKQSPNQQDSEESEGNNQEVQSSSPIYPTVKWIDSEQVLTCSSGMKIELFSIQRVIPVRLQDGQSEIWLGQSTPEVIYVDGMEDSRKKSLFEVRQDDVVDEFATSSYSSFVSSHRSSAQKPLVSEIEVFIRPARVGGSGCNNNSRNSMGQSSPVLEYRYSREEKESSDPNNGYNPDGDDLDDDDDYPINDVESPSRIEELPPDGGEVVEENLGEAEADDDLKPEQLRHSETNDIDPGVTILSMPESLAQVDTFGDEYSDEVSSEPDCGLNVALENSIENCTSIPYLEIDKTSTLRKRSQQYMADDEADDIEDQISTSTYRKSVRRKSVGSTPFPPLSRERAPARSTDACTPPEESDHHPRSSSANDTEFSRETYSSPFSCAPTTAEDIEEVALEEIENDEVLMMDASILSGVYGAPDTGAANTARSQSSSTTVSLQIPPVPKISGVIVPSERQSDVLLQNIEDPPTALQPELMRYKPPPTSTNTAAEPCNIDILHAGAIGTRLEKMSSPREEVAALYLYDGEEEDDEERSQEDVTTINGSADITTFSSSDHPCRYRNSSV